MTTPPASDAKVIRVGMLEGRPVYGGELQVKLRVRGDEMVLLEIFYAAGVGTPLHSHTHESVIYLVSGKLKATIEDKTFVMMPGDTCRHPAGVLHGAEALEDAVILECKSPAPDLSAFMTAG
ncbi:MAG: cupin domain-containing protein [Hyphomonadaceae bacterium]|jgi:quercetin dioxygenase-like cupin family protein|nr:cupin domain-containing protein [Hyphomonadaceae bacterium]